MAKNINLLVTIVCEEGMEDGIEDAVTACLNSLDHIEGYIFDTEDREWEDMEAEDEAMNYEKVALNLLDAAESTPKKQDN